MGPTVWITYFAGRRPPPVMTALPAGKRPISLTIFLHSARIEGPPARWIAPSTPPPPSREELAAFTMASADSFVMSAGPRKMMVLPFFSDMRESSIEFRIGRGDAEHKDVNPG